MAYFFELGQCIACLFDLFRVNLPCDHRTGTKSGFKVIDNRPDSSQLALLFPIL